METITTLLSGAAGAALVGGVFGVIMWRLNRKAAREDKTSQELAGLVRATRMLLYIEIKDRARQYIQSNGITPEDLEDLLSMHAIYHDELGGNGFLDSVMAQVRRLPIHN